MSVNVKTEASLHNREDAPLVPHFRIQPVTGWAPLKLNELWDYRELLYFLTWRDVKVRYKQAALGVLWAIIQPVMTMVVFTLFFGRGNRIDTGGIPYPIFSLAALVPWWFFQSGVTLSANSLVGSVNLIKKVYFPRLCVPIASILSCLVDFALSMLILLPMMLYYGRLPTANVIFLPLFLLLAFITALGVGLWLSALNVQYRDVRYIVGFLTQLWMFASPVIYASHSVGPKWQFIYALNPMAGVLDGFRWALLGMGDGPGPSLAISTGVALLLLVSGALYFRRMEQTFADVV